MDKNHVKDRGDEGGECLGNWRGVLDAEKLGDLSETSLVEDVGHHLLPLALVLIELSGSFLLDLKIRN